jgi:hypothetical protein
LDAEQEQCGSIHALIKMEFRISTNELFEICFLNTQTSSHGCLIALEKGVQTQARS